MKINYLNLKAFGHFTDFHLFFDENKNFHLLYGPNEAGKSTILRSISNYLYGFPRSTGYAFLHSNRNLRIEGELQKSNGEKLQFARRKGQSNTVLDASNNPIDEKKVEQFLNGMAEQHFNNMFALDHVRLREGGESLLKSDGNLGQSLFSAASGINVLQNVLNELDSKSINLYAKNRSKTAINSAITAEKEASKKITENQMKIQDWKDLERKYKDGEKEIERLKEQIKQLKLEENKFSRLKQTLPKIAQLKELQEKVAEHSNVPDLQESFEELWKENLKKLDAATTAKKTAEADLEKLKLQLQNIVIPAGILEQAALIEGLYRESEGYKNDVKQLPILEGKYQQLEQSIFAQLKDLGQATENLEIVEQYRINVETKKTIGELAEKKPILENNLQKANEDHASLDKELRKIHKDIQELAEVADVDSLTTAINRVRAEGRLEKALKEKQEELQQIDQQMTDLLSTLPLFKGTSEELLQVKVPNLRETVKRFQKQFAEIFSEIDDTNQKISAENKAIEGYENRIRELESLADIPTVSELQDSRNHRDAGWLVIRQKLNTGDFNQTALAAFSKGVPIDMAFEKSIRDTDVISDKMRVEAEKVGEKNKLLADIETSKKKVGTLTSELGLATERLKAWEIQWKEYWQPANFEPLTPEEMLEWLEKYNSFLKLNQQKQMIASQLQGLEEKIVEFKTLLQGELAAIGTVIATSTLEDLVETAERTGRRLSEAKNKRENMLSSLKNLQDKLDAAMEKKEQASKDLAAWQENWEKAIENLAVSKDSSPTVIKELLEAYEECVNNYDQLKQTVKDRNDVAKRITSFENRVTTLNQTISTNFVPNAMDIVVGELFRALQTAKTDQVEMANLEKQLTQAENRIKEADEQMSDAKALIEKLLEQASCDSVEEMEKIEAAYKEKCELTKKIAQLEESIIELGNGRSLDELLQEASLADKDTLDIELEEVQADLKKLDQDRSDMEQAHGVVKKDYLEKIEGTSFESVKAAEEKQSKLAEIANYTDEYITYKLASLLLQKGIEFYRENNQSPILNRASEIFRRITLASFDGLTVEYDKKDQPVIMGVRNKDELVEISGMSDGTTDQLYLALRIASIEKYVNENEPLPLIVDDILVHFDDERSKETLKVLLELSEHTQIIFFSHHYRLIELMEEVTTERTYQLKELQTVNV